MRRTLGILLGAAAFASIGVAVPVSAQGARSDVVLALEYRPFTFNPISFEGDFTPTRLIAGMVLPGAYELQPDFTYAPDVLVSEAVVTEDPFSVTYTIKPEAVWSDGVPVSSSDFVFTWESITDERFVGDLQGYELISEGTLLGPKSVRFDFKRPYPGFEALFDNLLPEHELDGRNMRNVWRNRITLSAGPFEFAPREERDPIVLRRNETYWGTPPQLDEVEFLVVGDQDEQAEALQEGRVDVINPSSVQPSLVRLHNDDSLAIQSSPSSLWEHLDFQFKRGRVTKQAYVRQAIAFAIDRESIKRDLLDPIGSGGRVLNNLVFLTNESSYESHFDRYSYDPEMSIQILEEAGCSRNEKGIYECSGRPLRMKIVSTRPNDLRELVARRIKRQLEAVGIDVRLRLLSPDIAFGKLLASEQWEAFEFAWVYGAPNGYWREDIWRCNGVSNYMNYCNREVSTLLKQARQEMDPTVRAQLVNDADELMAADIPSIPLFQRPTFLAYDARLQGVIDNPTEAGPTWNIEDWHWAD